MQFSASGDKVLACSPSTKPKLLDRHGAIIKEYSSGDPYVYDQSKTCGHISAINCIRWNPQNKKEFATCSVDSTIRIWDVELTIKPNLTITVKGKQMKKTPLSKAIYDPSGKWIICTAQDGGIRIFARNGPHHRASKEIVAAHKQGSEVTGIALDRAGQKLITRANDDTMKVWDLRQLKQAVNTIENLPTAHSELQCAFSPEEDYIITGTSDKKEGGKLVIFHAESMELEYEKLFSHGVNCVNWHPKLNQIFVGLLDGTISTLYDPERSVKGVLMCQDRLFKSQNTSIVVDNSAEGIVLNPDDETPLNEQYNIKKMVKGQKETRKPELPIPPEAKMKKLRTTMTQQILQSTIKEDLRDLDPRDALLSYAEAAEKEPFWVTPAYKKTQPKPVFDTTPYEDESNESKK